MIFTGIGVLLSVGIFSIPLPRRQLEHPLSKATKAASFSQDALVNIFERIENFFRRLETYVQVPPTPEMTDMIVKIMTEVLSILAIATREFGQSRASKLIACMNRHLSTDYCSEKYLTKVIGKTNIDNGLARLDRLTQEEVRMAAAQGLKATHAVHDEVRSVDGHIQQVDDRVRNVGSDVQQVDVHVQNVDHKVQAVDNKMQQVAASAKVQKVGKGLGWPFQGKDGPFQGKVMTIQGVGRPIQGLTRHQLHYLRLKLLLMR